MSPEMQRKCGVELLDELRLWVQVLPQSSSYGTQLGTRVATKKRKPNHFSSFLSTILSVFILIFTFVSP